MKIKLTSTGAYVNGKLVNAAKEHKTIVAMMLHRLKLQSN